MADWIVTWERASPYDSAWAVRRNGLLVTHTKTKWGARYEIAKMKREEKRMERAS